MASKLFTPSIPLLFTPVVERLRRADVTEQWRYGMERTKRKSRALLGTSYGQYISMFCRFPTGIASLDFNREGTRLAIASSYTFEEGEKE